MAIRNKFPIANETSVDRYEHISKTDNEDQNSKDNAIDNLIIMIDAECDDHERNTEVGDYDDGESDRPSHYKHRVWQE